MLHEETVKMVNGAKVAVLFIHGIAGTPEHFRVLLPLEQLIPEEWSVYNLLLPGHGGTVEDFSHSSMAGWKEYANVIFDRLCETHEKVILVGHSMGTLFSVQMALRRPEKVAFLFLIASPMLVGVKPYGAINLIKLSWGILDEHDPFQAALGKVSAIRHTPLAWRYIGWLPRLYELLREMKSTQSLVSELTVKCIAFQSRRDELVSCRSCDILRSSGKVELHGLRGSSHFYYAPHDVKTVQKRFLDELKRWQ